MGIVVGSSFPSFIGEGEVGEPLLPTIGGLARTYVDFTRLSDHTSLLNGLLGWVPLRSTGLYQPQLHQWPHANRALFTDYRWSLPVDAGFSPQGSLCCRPGTGGNELYLGDTLLNEPSGGRPAQGTIAMWVRVPVLSGTDHTLFRYGTATSNIGFGVSSAGGVLAFQIEGSPVGLSISSQTPFADGGWHHIALAGEGSAGSSNWRIWIDGVEITPIEFGTPKPWFFDLAEDTPEGRILDGGAEPIDVMMCDFGVWSRVLSASEIWILAKSPTLVYSRRRSVVAVEPFVLRPSGIASTSAFGTAKVNQQVRPDGIASTNAFGTPTVVQQLQLQVPGIASTSAFGTAKVNLKVTVTGVASTSAFGTATIAQQVRPAGIASTSTFGTAKVNLKVTVTGVASTSAFGTAKVNLKVTVTGVASTSAFGTATLAQQVRPIGIASASAFGVARIQQQVRPIGIASTNAFGTPTVLLSQIVIVPGTASTSAFGTPTVLRAQIVVVVGIASTNAFGTAVVSFPGLTFIVALDREAHIGGLQSQVECGNFTIRNSQAGDVEALASRHHVLPQPSEAGSVNSQAGI